MRFHRLNLLIVFFALTAVAQAQDRDRIIAGYHLEKLACALENHVTVIDLQELQTYIYRHQLSAILIPRQQSSSRKMIGICFDKQRCSGSSDLQVTEHDYAQLVDYADHKAFAESARVNSLKEGGSAKEFSDAKTQLNEYAAALREPEKAPTRRFIGSVLADSKPTDPDLVQYVNEYRDYVRQNAKDALAAMLRSSTLTAGEPMVTTGSASFTAADLEKVNPADVEEFAVGTNKFKGAWVGSTFVLVRQSDQNTTSKDPSGLGLNETWAKSSFRTIPQIPVNGVSRNPVGEQVATRTIEIRGVVIKRDADSFTIAEAAGGPETTVLLTSSTDVKSHNRGAFQGSKEYGASYILRGLRLEVSGTKNDEGQLVANKIRFAEQDLRTAQALKGTADPTETARNEELIAKQQEQERLAAQIAENVALSPNAKGSAEAAEAVRRAQDAADSANNRINGLDDFDPVKTITVYFATGSATLSPRAKAEIDMSVALLKNQDTRGWVAAVVGYADTTGNSARNMNLSERRSNAVIYYLVTKYKLPLNRLVQPFGYGEQEPVAGNTTRAGRSKNRRVEIRLMVNKGIARTPGI